MDSPILHFFSVLSAHYQVKRDHWNDVALEIYYHRGHEYDLDKMMQGMKAALDYCSGQFAPYQHRQVRILEFPRYESYAQSFPNTIPYSEAIGFIAKVDPADPEDIDYPFYITAHEVAHQWWAHQVIGGNVQGATMLSETMSQYSALMAMKHAFGAAKMKRFLKYELDRYLRGRGLERKKEVPLVRVENQPYIHYEKGSLVMYALQDYIGEEALNRALSAYLRAVRFQEPPYTNSLELLGYIRKATPPELQYLLDDWFENITLYDNRAISASSTKTADHKYEVTLRVAARKLRAAGLGAEQEVPVDDLVDVGVVDEQGEPLFLQKRRVKSGETVVTMVVDRLPAKAGIDPLNKLIDRNPDDNLTRVATP
jgi:aminopeptidase N